jgi:hypothetical protein
MMDENKIMHAVFNSFPSKPTVTSHSLGIDYITQLCKDSKDIEFVKQSKDHQTLNITFAYVDKLSD